MMMLGSFLMRWHASKCCAKETGNGKIIAPAMVKRRAIFF